MATTLKSNLVIPEVIADLVETKLGDRVSLLPLAVQDNTLQGQPGDTLKFPAFRYIGKAEEVTENGQITANLLTSFAVSSTVRKFAKAVQITDEARLSSFGDPVGEAAVQLAHAIDHAVDDALFSQLAQLPYSRLYPVTALTADAVADGLTLFGERLDGEKILLVNPAGFAALRKDPDYIQANDLGQRMIFSGVVGEIWGCQIVVSNKVKFDSTLGETRFYIVKPGALRLVNKTGTFVEVKRDPEYMRDTIYASKHCAAYLYDDSRAAALTIYSALQELSTATHGIRCVASLPGKTAVYIPEALAAAPEGYGRRYTLDANATVSYTFGTTVASTSVWGGSEAGITVGANTHIHLILCDNTSKKPVKFIHLPVVAGT